MANGKKPIELIPIKDDMLNSENYGVIAENVMKPYMSREREKNLYQQLSVSKLRQIYGLIMNLYTQINVPDDFNSHKGDLQYLRVKMAYESGREKAVERFLKETKLMDAIDAVQTYEQFMLYCRYAESLVAYFKFYGGRD